MGDPLLPTMRLARESAIPVDDLLHQITLIKLIRALAYIYLAIDRTLCPHAALDGLLLATELRQRDGLRISHFIGEAWLLFEEDVASLLADPCWFPIVSVPALLDLLGLLGHLPWDHVHLVVRIDKRTGLVHSTVPLIEAVAPSVRQSQHELFIVEVSR